MQHGTLFWLSLKAYPGASTLLIVLVGIAEVLPGIDYTSHVDPSLSYAYAYASMQSLLAFSCILYSVYSVYAVQLNVCRQRQRQTSTIHNYDIDWTRIPRIPDPWAIGDH